MNPNAPVPPAPVPPAPAPAAVGHSAPQAAPTAPFVPAPAPAPAAPVASAPPAPQPLQAPIAPQPAPLPPIEAPRYYALVGGQATEAMTAEEIRGQYDVNQISVCRVGDNAWQPGNTIADAGQPAPQLAPPPGTNPVPRPTPGRPNPAITLPATGYEAGGSGEVVGDATGDVERNEDGFIPGEEVPYDVLAKHLREKHNGNVPNKGVGESAPFPERKQLNQPS